LSSTRLTSASFVTIGAALGIVLAYYGRTEPLEVLRVACAVSRDGSKAPRILQAARSYGMEAKGWKAELAAVRLLEPPLIVFWEFDHFLVVEGFDGNRVYLNDPASGPRTVTEAEFDAGYTGVLLMLRPGPEFTRGGRKRSLWRGLQQRLSGSGSALTYVVMVNLALAVPGLYSPSFGRVFVDEIVVGGARHWLLPLLFLMGCTTLLVGSLSYLLRHSLARFAARLAQQTSSQFIWHLLKLPFDFFQQRFAGDLAARVGQNQRVAELLSGDLARSLLGCAMLFFFSALMAAYDVVLCLIAMALATLNLLALLFMRRARHNENLKLRQSRGQLDGIVANGLRIIETLKASGTEDGFFARWADQQAKVVSTEQRVGTVTQYLHAVPSFLGGVSTATILGVGTLRVLDGHLSIGQLIAFQALSMSFLHPVNELVNLGSTLQEVEGDLVRLDDVLHHQESPAFRRDDGGVGRPLGAPENGPAHLLGDVELRQVRFGYNRLDPPLIESLTLRLRPGSRVALVGSSGSGKSTVAKLLAGLFTPWSGEILLDGQPRQEIPRPVLCSSVAIVDQDIVLFEGSVRDNLTLWDASISESAVVSAAQAAAIHDDIMARPGGYDARVEPDGRNFSGGQRQRMELARALVRNPSVLVLDEGTSALDAVTEMLVERNLRPGAAPA